MRNGDEFVAIHNQLVLLHRLVKNLLIDNKNLQPIPDGPFDYKQPTYFEEYPHTHQYVRGPLKSQANYILKSIENIIDIVDADSK